MSSRLFVAPIIIIASQPRSAIFFLVTLYHVCCTPERFDIYAAQHSELFQRTFTLCVHLTVGHLELSLVACASFAVAAHGTVTAE